MKVAYICNCKKNCNTSNGCILNGGPCSHTTDVAYSKNYTETPLIAEDSNFVRISDDFQEMSYYEEVSNHGSN